MVLVCYYFLRPLASWWVFHTRCRPILVKPILAIVGNDPRKHYFAQKTTFRFPTVVWGILGPTLARLVTQSAPRTDFDRLLIDPACIVDGFWDGFFTPRDHNTKQPTKTQHSTHITTQQHHKPRPRFSSPGTLGLRCKLILSILGHDPQRSCNFNPSLHPWKDTRYGR